MRKSNVVFLVLIWIAFSDTIEANAQVYPADFAQVLVANGITNPTAMAFAPDGRIFVSEQGGKLRVIKNNALLPTSFVQLTVSSTGERGLIGIALDPDFIDNNFIYLYYTVPGTPSHNRISRFTANGDVALVGSEFVVLELDALSTATNHNGGAMHFGKDGKLYVAVGENANSSHAQNLNTYHGKLLRINKDGTVPDDNPFNTGSEQQKRVWAYGLRNPFTFSVHPGSGRILVNDVGQVTWEEINDATTGGKNFGWPTTEGNFNPATYPNFTNPIYSYQHGSGDGKGCAITGGVFFYPPTTNYPSNYLGRYFFQEWCNNWINLLDLSGSAAVRSPFATAISGNGLALTVGNDGNLYYLSRTANALYKIIYNKTTSPYITNHPASATVAEGQPVSLEVTSLGSTPFVYQWQKDGDDIPGETNSTFAIVNAVPGDAGQYRVIVSNTAGTAISNAATLSVIENAFPVAEIITPVSGDTYAAGTAFNFSGVGTDAEDGILPASAFNWEINFHHDTHKHDQPPLEGISGSFDIPNEGETSDNVWYRIVLTVTDSRGSVGKDSVDIHPKKSTITLLTDPPGLQVTLDGQPVTTPLEVVSVEGILRTIGVITPQATETSTHEFESWSNGGIATQTLPTPEDDLQLIANFSFIVGAEENLVSGKDPILYPNPARAGAVTIVIFVEKKQDVSFQLVDLLSRHVTSLEQNLKPGENRVSFPLDKLQRGIYSMLIKLTDRTVMKKLAVVGE